MNKNNKNSIQSKVVEELLSKLPENIADLYPNARKLFRHFNLYVGPTNSGKTYQATRPLYKCGHGIYLGPLRLLAYEQYVTLNENNVKCSLLTGEESLVTRDSTVQASTVEMLDLKEDYDCVVIDEAQMIDDRDRGGKWTRAILGAKCPEINVCCAPEAKDLIIKLIEMCGDTYTIINTERTVPLAKANKVFKFPSDVSSGDALIVFSRRDVHMIADELRQRGRKVSIIYGNLPYDVRQSEAKKFSEGENDILVSTDAIGMGLNLPIKRVIFLKYTKYIDGEERFISPMEAKQIAGRAGRMHIYNKGTWSCVEQDGMKYIQEQINSKVKSTKISLSFPEISLDSNHKLKDLLHAWQYEIKSPQGFIKENVLDKLELCKYAETLIMDREILWKLISIKFDIKRKDEYTYLFYEWFDIVKHTAKQLNDRTGIPYKPTNDLDVCNKSLDKLEDMYKLCDMLYRYYEIFGFEEERNKIQEKKLQISHCIMNIIDRKSRRRKSKNIDNL